MLSVLNILTCAKCDCTCLVESFRVGGCDENCDTSVLLLVTDRASLANLLRPANRSPGVGQGNGKNKDKPKNKQNKTKKKNTLSMHVEDNKQQ